jgi:hypothetical protein
VRALLAVVVLAAVVASVAAARSQNPPLKVTQKFLSCCYVEGSIGYIQIVNRAGRRIAQKTFRGATKELRFALMPGRYRMTSFQRPCDGNCSYLDPPTDRCSRSFRIEARVPVTATVLVSPGSGCRIRFG